MRGSRPSTRHSYRRLRVTPVCCLACLGVSQSGSGIGVGFGGSTARPHDWPLRIVRALRSRRLTVSGLIPAAPERVVLGQPASMAAARSGPVAARAAARWVGVLATSWITRSRRRTSSTLSDTRRL